jgi:hypothetical protein
MIEQKFQEGLKNHQIKPSAKAWERIEADLDSRNKKASWVIYTRWAAAASVALIVTAYASWNNVPIQSQVATQKETKTTPAMPATTIINETNTTLQYTDNQLIKPKNTITPIETQIQKVNNNIATKGTKENAAQHATLNENLAQTEKIITQNKIESPTNPRNIERQMQFLKTQQQAILIAQKDVALLLPEMPSEMKEKSRIERKWQKFLAEDWSEESDSTFSEKAIVFAEQKTKNYISKFWTPRFKKWFK